MKNKLVGFMGAPGTGKTTLAFAMKEYAMRKGYSSDVCSECAREHCYKYGVPKTPYSQYRINLEQIDRENIFLKGNNDYIFEDSCLWMGYAFTLVNFRQDQGEEARSIIDEIYNRFVIEQMGRYHKVFHLKYGGLAFDDGCRDLDVNKKLATVMDGFVLAHQHILPIVTVDIPIDKTEQRKDFIWEHLAGDGA